MRLTDDQIKMARITYTKVVQDDFILDLIDTIEALRRENEQLRAQVARVREALRKASAWDRVNWFECGRCKNMRDALAAIDKAIGGKEDAE